MSTVNNVVDNSKTVHAITRNLQSVLNIKTENVTKEDVNEILSLSLPVKQIDNLIKITTHTNANLLSTKTSLHKNRNLIAEEISCLNEFIYESANTENEVEEKDSTPKNIQSEVQKSKTDEEGKDVEDDTPKEKMSNLEYSTRKLLAEQKMKKKEVLVPPPKLDLNKLKGGIY